MPIRKLLHKVTHWKYSLHACSACRSGHYPQYTYNTLTLRTSFTMLLVTFYNVKPVTHLWTPLAFADSAAGAGDDHFPSHCHWERLCSPVAGLLGKWPENPHEFLHNAFSDSRWWNCFTADLNYYYAMKECIYCIFCLLAFTYSKEIYFEKRNGSCIVIAGSRRGKKWYWSITSKFDQRSGTRSKIC